MAGNGVSFSASRRSRRARLCPPIYNSSERFSATSSVPGSGLSSQTRALFVPAERPTVLIRRHAERLAERTIEDDELDERHARDIGVPSEKVTISTLPIHFNKVLTGSHGGDAVPHVDIPRLIKLAAAGKLSFDGIITHEFPLEEINAALDMVRSGAAGRVLVNL